MREVHKARPRPLQCVHLQMLGMIRDSSSTGVAAVRSTHSMVPA